MERIVYDENGKPLYFEHEMELDEAIERNRAKAIEYSQLANDHSQLAEWLTDYKKLTLV